MAGQLSRLERRANNANVVGSTPTLATYIVFPVLQLIWDRRPRLVLSQSPRRQQFLDSDMVISHLYFSCSLHQSSVPQCSGYHVRLTRERSPVRARAELTFLLCMLSSECYLFYAQQNLTWFAFFVYIQTANNLVKVQKNMRYLLGMKRFFKRRLRKISQFQFFLVLLSDKLTIYM